MSVSAGRRRGRRLLLSASLAVLVAVAAVVAAGASSAAAAGGFPAKAGSLHKIYAGRAFGSAAKPAAKPAVKTVPSHSHGKGNGKGAPGAPGLPKGKAQLSHNFNGLTDADQAAANGDPLFEVTPPDQGLCVGYDPTVGGEKVVFEPINSAVRETDVNGNPIRPDFSLAELFGDPSAEGDVRCFYDTSTHSFYFTEIGFAANGDTTIDLAVLDPNFNETVYQIDTYDGQGTACFGDQPHVGYDANNLYLSIDEFCGGAPVYPDYLGAVLFVVSKSQVVNEVPSPNMVSFGPLSLDGNPVLTLEPAIDSAASTEYLLNSVSTDAEGNPLASSNTLGLWQVSGGSNVTTGNFGAVSLQSTAVTSETYGFPVPALSTGDGSVTDETVEGLTLPVTSETALQPDDDRMLQVIGTGSGNNERIYGALDTALTPTGDNTVRDGAAWFELAPTHTNGNQSPIMKQGYVSSNGAYLLYPAIYPTNSGNVMTFTITSPTLNPSAAYSITGGNGAFTNIAIADQGVGPHLSFADSPPFNSSRWGDYSAATLDPNGSTIWMATEWIPQVTQPGAPFDNWGTAVFSIH